MDVYSEQLVKIRMSPARITAIAVTYFMGLVVSAFVFFIGFIFNIVPVSFLVAAGIMFISWKSACGFFLEYEYINTNGEVDIDKIINKRKRERIISFNCREIESVRKYVKGEVPPQNASLKIYACSPNEDSYSMLIRTEHKGLVYIVFSPDSDTVETIKKFMKREIALNAFDK